MIAKPLLVATLLLATLLPMQAHAGEADAAVRPPVQQYRYDHEERVRTDPPSGHYVHVPSWSLYHYDAGTGTLTPTGQPAGARDHADIEVYRRGAMPDPSVWPASISRCEHDFCIALVVALVDAEYDISLYSRAFASCKTEPLTMSRAFGQSEKPVTYIAAFFGVNYCHSGQVSAEVRFNGLAADADFTPY